MIINVNCLCYDDFMQIINEIPLPKQNIYINLKETSATMRTIRERETEEGKLDY